MILLKSKRVVLENAEKPASLLIDGEIIKEILPYATDSEISRNIRIIDYENLVLLPGVVDTHVHINQPGRTDWEGFSTATSAAAMGGITTLVDMPLNCKPVTTSVSALQTKLSECKNLLHVDCGFYGGIVPENLNELESLCNAGILGFKSFLIHSGIDDFRYVDESHIRKAIPVLKKYAVPYLLHAELEDAVLEQRGADPALYATYLASRPRRWENNAIDLIARVSGETNAHLHVVHLSSTDKIPLLQETKKNRIPVSIETCHHYLTFCAEEIPEKQTEYKCAPPIRERENREELWNALESGVIDFAVSDHSPCTPELKLSESGNFMNAWGGIAGLQFSLSVFYTGAVQRKLNLQQISKVLSEKPAKFAGLKKKGVLQKGYLADIAVFNPDLEFVVEKENIAHRYDVTPYLGMKLRGKVLETWLRGKQIYGNNTLHEASGQIILRGTT